MLFSASRQRFLMVLTCSWVSWRKNDTERSRNLFKKQILNPQHGKFWFVSCNFPIFFWVPTRCSVFWYLCKFWCFLYLCQLSCFLLKHVGSWWWNVLSLVDPVLIRSCIYLYDILFQHCCILRLCHFTVFGSILHGYDESYLYFAWL